LLQANRAIAQGVNIIILSDRGVNQDNAPIPALLAVSGLHHHLIREGTRTRVGLVLESGEPREVHHYALLIGYGCGAINPYLAFETIDDMIHQGLLVNIDHKTACKNYVKAATKGVIKVASKIGISTIQSYRGAQIFEAVGLNQSVIDKYFTWTASRIEGADLEIIAKEAILRHSHAFPDRPANGHTLDVGGEYQWRKNGEAHLFSPETIHTLQKAVREGSYELYKQYATLVNEQGQKHFTLRGLLEFKQRAGANRGGRQRDQAGRVRPLRRHERVPRQRRRLQIKMAQGAKPGEGGQLPGHKVYPYIAKTRHSTPGVGLISPPPHHDIYSIEDLAQLIHDLKNANPRGADHVKLVSEVGVGTVAAGVAKAHADVVLISGHDGGTGASPLTSLKHAGSRGSSAWPRRSRRCC
jgi:glutamate synthase (NADPH/NADH) large chain